MELSLNGKKIYFLGRLAGMTRREAEKLVRGNGAKVAGRLNDSVNIIVVGELNFPGRNWSAIAQKFDHLTRIAFENGNLEILVETDFWKKLDLNIETSTETEGPLYTSAMIAELICVPLSTIRLWIQHEFLKPGRRIGKLLYFDFKEVLAAKHLLQLFSLGLSLEFVSRKILEFEESFPTIRPILLQLIPHPNGHDILLKDQDELFNSSGQQHFNFDPALPQEAQAESVPIELDLLNAAIPSSANSSIGTSLAHEKINPYESILSGREEMFFRRRLNKEVVQLCENAWESETNGNLNEAIQLYRLALAFGGPDAGICFQLAELLQKNGELAAAKERYYMVLELDEDYVEARANLGKVLVGLHELDEAIAAYSGVLSFRPDDAEIHFELGRLYFDREQISEAEEQFLIFCQLAPNSPHIDQVDQILSEIQKRRSNPAPSV